MFQRKVRLEIAIKRDTTDVLVTMMEMLEKKKAIPLDSGVKNASGSKNRKSRSVPLTVSQESNMVPPQIIRE